MAGDWIKMRGELATHPRLSAIYNQLVYGDDSGFLIYVCGMDALDIGVVPARDDTVTERALRCVTERALRDVALSSLLRVWCAVNAHCKVDDTDAIMSPMTLSDLDDIAGFSGFGDAMQTAGWVLQQDDNSLRFHNFLEFNEPACLRHEPLTGAERAKLWRERKKAALAAKNGGVTKVTKRNGREEKRRYTPKSPKGDLHYFEDEDRKAGR
jgi:hypothetical protein